MGGSTYDIRKKFYIILLPLSLVYRERMHMWDAPQDKEKIQVAAKQTSKAVTSLALFLSTSTRRREGAPVARRTLASLHHIVFTVIYTTEVEMGVPSFIRGARTLLNRTVPSLTLLYRNQLNRT